MRKPEHPNVGRAGFLPSFSQNQRTLSSSDLQSLSDGVRGATLSINKRDPNLQVRQSSSGLSIASNYKEPFDPDAFEVTWIGDDTFNIRGGNCQFMQYETSITVGEEGLAGTPNYVYQSGYGMSNIVVDRPVVWSESRPKAPTKSNTSAPNDNPTLDKDYIVCPKASSASPKAKSDKWSVIIGMPVPSNTLKPCLYVVPRIFAGTNLVCGHTPFYSLRNVTGIAYGSSYVGEVNINQGSTLTGDLESGYYLENISGPMPHHEHTYLALSAMQAKWTTVCFSGMVLAHMDWDATKKVWEVTQYHKGNVTLLSFASLQTLGVYQGDGEIPFNWTQSFADVWDRYWSTSVKVTTNSGGLNSGANLRYQEIEYPNVLGFW